MRRAIAFLTPFGGAAVPSPGTLDWFPVVGAVIGLAVGGVWWLAGRAWPLAAAAGIALASDVVLTGYLHLDGLADAADGLLPPMERDRRLEVMRDPAVGAFGAVTLVVVLVLRFGAFASTVAVPLVVGALWCGSRAAMAVVARTAPYAAARGSRRRLRRQRPRQPARALPPDERRPRARRGGHRPGGGDGGPRRGGHGLAAVGAEWVAMAGVVVLAQRRIGGFTGDVLGAAGVVGETVGLLVLAARW